MSMRVYIHICIYIYLSFYICIRIYEFICISHIFSVINSRMNPWAEVGTEGLDGDALEEQLASALWQGKRGPSESGTGEASLPASIMWRLLKTKGPKLCPQASGVSEQDPYQRGTLE